MKAALGEVADRGRIVKSRGGFGVVGVSVGAVVEVLDQGGENLWLFLWQGDFLFGSFAEFALQGGTEEGDTAESSLGGVELDIVDPYEKRHDG